MVVKPLHPVPRRGETLQLWFESTNPGHTNNNCFVEDSRIVGRVVCTLSQV